MKRLATRLAVTLAVGAAAGFCAVAIRSAEGALHPTRRAVAPECPCVTHVRCGDASVTAPDTTKLSAWYYQPDQPNGAAVILLHGVGANREDLVGFGTLFEKAGYSVLVPDLRGHGRSDGFTTYGAFEEQDIHAWADWMLARPGISRIYGYGVSLGGSVLIESLNREPRFRAVVAESAYTTFPDVADERIARLLPAPARWIAQPFVSAGLLWGRLRYDADLRRASPLDAVRHAKTPILLIHGLADHKTEADNSRRLAAANPGTTTLWLVPGAGHANARATAKQEFDSRVMDWFQQH